MHARDMVDAGGDSHALLQRAEPNRMGADVHQVGTAHRREVPFGVQSQFGRGGHVAGLIVAQESLRPFASPFDRPPNPFRGPDDQREFGIGGAAGAEIASDVMHDHADVARCRAQDGHEIGFRAHHAAGPGVERVFAGGRIVFADGGTRFHRHAGDALDPGRERHRMRGGGEGGRCRGLVAELGIDADIGCNVVAHLNRPWFRRRQPVTDGWQRLIIDGNQFGRVLGGGHGRRDNHRHDIPDMHDLTDGHRVMRRDRGDGAVSVWQRHLGWVPRPNGVRDGFQPVRQHVLASQHGQHGRNCQGRSRIDSPDPRMRVRRAQHERIGLVGQVGVVAVVALPRQKAQILLAAGRLADHGTSRR